MKERRRKSVDFLATVNVTYEQRKLVLEKAKSAAPGV